MIALNTLKEQIESKLNALGTIKGLHFYVVTDTGEYKKPERVDNTVTDFVNGVFTLIGSEVSNLTDGTIIATQTANLSLAMRLPDFSADEEYNAKLIEGSETKILQLREVLQSITQSSEFEEMQDENGTSYFVSTVYQFANTGQRAMLPQIGDSMTFSLNIVYMFVQNGVNTRNTTFTLGGLLFPYQAMTINRAKTYDTNVFADTTNGEVENIPIQSNWSVTFELPAVIRETFYIMLDFLLGGKLVDTHLLGLTIQGERRIYLVTIGEESVNGETIKNLGVKITFLKARKNYLFQAFNNQIYHVYRATTAVASITSEVDCVYCTANGNNYGALGATIPQTVNFKETDIIITTGLLTANAGLEQIQ